ncbi:MAG: NAD(P)-dependent alcohol dehydrogenase [Deinococcota bacterium]
MKGLVTHHKNTALDTTLKIPSANRNEILVKIMAASVTSTDVAVSQGYYDMLFKLLGVRQPVKTGLEFSGIVIEGDTTFKHNDKVFGYVHLIRGPKTHQEYIAVPKNYIAHMPLSLSFEEAASLPLGALTSLIALEELADVSIDDHVLINGASGGLGIHAVQIAKLLGAQVTAIAGPNQETFLSQLGANHIFNYQETPLQTLPSSSQFDVIFDLTTKLKFKGVQHLLSAKGIFVPTDPFKVMLDIASNVTRTKKTKYLMVTKGNQRKLRRITKWVEDGKLNAFCDSVHLLSNHHEAFARSQISGKRGRVVLKIADNIT